MRYKRGSPLDSLGFQNILKHPLSKNTFEMSKSFNFTRFIFISLCFIFFTIIGTLTHELGHCAVAKYLGMENIVLHYGSMNYDNPMIDCQSELYTKYEIEIRESKNFPEKALYEELSSDIKYKSLMVRAGGPFQTMMTGTIGFIVLILFGNKFKINGELKLIGWLWIYLSLFWLRQTTNFFASLIIFIINGFKWSRRSDEMILAYNLHLPIYSISLITGLIGVFVLLWITFFYLPRNIARTFILGGLIGGIAGYLIWFVWLGKYILL